MARTVRLIAASALALGLVACARDTTTPTQPGPERQPPTSTPASGEAWVAVIGSANDPSRLDPERERVLKALGDVLEGSVVVSPGACLDGLPARYADGYVVAIQRDNREDVQALTTQLPETPSFVGVVTVVCTD